MKLSDTKRDQIRTIVQKTGGVNVKVYVFGSQARGEARFGSDIDIGVARADGKPLPPGVLTDLKEAFDDSSIVERVDVVDLATAAPSFKTAIEKDLVAV